MPCIIGIHHGIQTKYLGLFSNKFKESMVCHCHCNCTSRILCLESISIATMVHIKTCVHVGTLQVWPCARSLRTEMLQKNLRRLTPTTFLLTPKALSATLLLKMNRDAFNVAHLDILDIANKQATLPEIWTISCSFCYNLHDWVNIPPWLLGSKIIRK